MSATRRCVGHLHWFPDDLDSRCECGEHASYAAWLTALGEEGVSQTFITIRWPEVGYTGAVIREASRGVAALISSQLPECEVHVRTARTTQETAA